MSFTLFLSLFAIGAGLGLLIREMFNFELPMPRYLSGVFVLLLGIHFMIVQLNKSQNMETYTVVFNERNFNYESDNSNEYVIVFGASRIDLQEAYVKQRIKKH
jgi:putative Mn2+ efflux pump MntP